MFTLLAHAKNDPAAEPVAQALAPKLLARVAIGENKPALELSHAAVVAVWSAHAAPALDEFLALCAHAETAILVRMDDTPVPDGVRAEIIDWARGGAPAVLVKLDAHNEASRAKRRGANPLAAGMLAVAGAFSGAVGGGAVAPAPRNVEDARVAGRTRHRQAEAVQTAVAAAAPQAATPVIDTDALEPPAPYDPEKAAEELLKHAPRHTVTLEETPRRTLGFLNLGGFFLRN